MKINENYLQLKDSYLFSRIAEKVQKYGASHPDKKIIRLGIGDVTLPLVPAVTEAMTRAVREMGEAATFKGYGDYEGYPFLRQAISRYYGGKGVNISENEIFVSDGAKGDAGNILDIFSPDNTVLIPDPVYPVYVDTNVMDGRKIIYMDGNEGNNFLPMPDESVRADIIYMCSPNNPTGAVYTKEQLKSWVDYANDCDAVILFDAAYEIFVQDENLPTSIFQINGAEKCAIEFGTLSKTAGFTGTRCGYTIISDSLVRGGQPLGKLWRRHRSTKYNGAPYIVQRGAEAVFTDAGWAQVVKNIAYYLENAKIITDTLTSLGIWFQGGRNAPYIWFKCPNGQKSWEYFDYLLENLGIVGTPGAGFGENGEGFFRLTAFGARESVVTAMERLKSSCYIAK